MTEIYDLFFQHLGDNIWSVRENAAGAIGSVIDAFGKARRGERGKKERDREKDISIQHMTQVRDLVFK